MQNISMQLAFSFLIASSSWWVATVSSASYVPFNQRFTSLPGVRALPNTRIQAKRSGGGPHTNHLPQNSLTEESELKSHWITECMTVASQPGHYIYQSNGEASTCGVYLAANPDQLVEIELEETDVPCDGSLLVVLDGWELNGSIFPDINDHELPMAYRVTEMCNERMPRKRRFISSQNAALIQYLIPTKGKGFSFRVRFLPNPVPCNILMSDMEGLFTMKNLGQAKNCSLTTLLFPANFEIKRMEIGGSRKTCRDCVDKVEIGGSSSLDSAQLVTKETFCECDAAKVHGKKSTILCGSSTVRMVSSEGSENTLSIWARPADFGNDLDFDKNIIFMCPEYMKYME
ncbi:corticotropin-releasing factor-binding protein-like [Tigriopus californicus]|uniref:corticotropin-releasing factor-binding protein-like n=1 Tax=Tigriopus californicus TaxID=6832 RepID=UPI0027DA4BB1|nr:corticotropin-releasing factor-binding protein-like [Tigriopus californicus]XP_059084231.1 corticotropin-releasing factor-binding protein-like [Tigriopus californicus]